MNVKRTIPYAAAVVALAVFVVLVRSGDEPAKPAGTSSTGGAQAAAAGGTAGGAGGGDAATAATAGGPATAASGGSGGGADIKPALSGEVPPTPPSSTKTTKPPKKNNGGDPPPPKPTASSPPPAPTPTVVEPAPQPTKTLDTPAKGSADEVAKQLDGLFVPVKLFHAKFKQKYTAKVHGTSKKSTGKVWIQKPGKLALKYEDPNKNRAVSDGTILKVYEHDNQQMFVKKVKNTEYPGAFAFILGNGLRQSFTFKFHKTSKWEGGPVIIGTPRLKNPGYKKVLFYIDGEKLKKRNLGCVRRVLVLDAQGNRNRFDFIKATMPESMDPKLFVFTPPPGTEIIKP